MPTAKIKKKLGRPSKKDTIDLIQLGKLAAKGFTDVELADFFNVSEVSLNAYKKDHDFLKSLKTNKEISDSRVVKSLYERALGYSHNKEKVTKDGSIIEYTESYPPDPTSMIFWLKNRQPKRWRDRVELSGDKDNPITINITKEDEKL